MIRVHVHVFMQAALCISLIDLKYTKVSIDFISCPYNSKGIYIKLINLLI